MTRHSFFVPAAALAIGVGLAACSSSTTAPSATTTSRPATQLPAPSSDMVKPTDIVDTAVAAGGFTTLAKALTAAGLVDTLKGPGPFTVFAPQDSAFAKLPAGTLETLLADPKGKLAPILTYHVVPGKVMAADVLTMSGKKVKTVNGAELTITVKDGKVALVDATGASVNVVKTDVTASNGVIHVLDGVLLPAN